MLAGWTVVVMPSCQFPTVVPVTRWLDPSVEKSGFSVVDPYVEVAWLPVVGPSATWMLRRLDAWLPDPESRVDVDLSELGQLLGLGPSMLPGSSVQRTLGRLVRFGLADWSGTSCASGRRFRRCHPVISIGCRHGSETCTSR